MAKITINLPEALEERVIDGFCKFHDYQETVWAANAIDRVPNPETKLQFMQRTLGEYIFNGVRTAEGEQAAETAKNSVEADLQDKLAPVLIPKVK